MAKTSPDKPTLDQIAVQHMDNVPRFLQALEQHRYVILDRDHLPRIEPTQAEIKAAARKIALEQREAEQKPPPEDPTKDLLLKKLGDALERHHNWLKMGADCPTCGLPRWR